MCQCNYSHSLDKNPLQPYHFAQSQSGKSCLHTSLPSVKVLSPYSSLQHPETLLPSPFDIVFNLFVLNNINTRWMEKGEGLYLLIA